MEDVVHFCDDSLSSVDHDLVEEFGVSFDDEFSFSGDFLELIKHIGPWYPLLVEVHPPIIV